MSILLTSDSGDCDLSPTHGGEVVLDHVMEAAADVRVNLWIGSDAKPCVALAGEWSLRLYVRRSGVTNEHCLEPAAQTIVASNSMRKMFVSKVIDLNTGDRIFVLLISPNEGDTDVTVYTELIHVTGALPAVVPGAVGGVPVLDANSLINVDVERLGGVVQSLTDLKHFADSGYDPH